MKYNNFISEINNSPKEEGGEKLTVEKIRRGLTLSLASGETLNETQLQMLVAMLIIKITRRGQTGGTINTTQLPGDVIWSYNPPTNPE